VKYLQLSSDSSAFCSGVQASSELTDASRGEQAAAGLDACTPEQKAELSELNCKYFTRHGFPFIIAGIRREPAPDRTHRPPAAAATPRRRMNASGTIEQLLDVNAVHAQWRAPLARALDRVEPDYLQQLLNQPDWLPGPQRLLAAFRRDREGCRYLLFGESPYPRAASANGIAFQDAAVGSLWSEHGLSKAVNRATSLRNLLKTALIAEGLIHPQPSRRWTRAD